MGRAGQWSEARSPAAGPRPSGHGFHSLRKKSQPGLSLRWGPGAPTCFPPQGGGDKGKAGMLGDRGRPSCHVTHTPCVLEGNKPVGVGARYEPDRREKPGKRQKRTRSGQQAREIPTGCHQLCTSSCQRCTSSGSSFNSQKPALPGSRDLGDQWDGSGGRLGQEQPLPRAPGYRWQLRGHGGSPGVREGAQVPLLASVEVCPVRGVEGRAHGQRGLRRCGQGRVVPVRPRQVSPGRQPLLCPGPSPSLLAGLGLGARGKGHARPGRAGALLAGRDGCVT